MVGDIINTKPHLALRDITKKANTGLCKTTVDKIISEAGFKLMMPRKNPFWRNGQKKKIEEFARRRGNWRKAWNWVVFVDEATIIYDPNHAGRKVRVRPG